MSARIRVVIVDDHPLFRQGLRQVIEADSRFQLSGEAGDGAAALQLIQEQKPDIVVLDPDTQDHNWQTMDLGRTLEEFQAKLEARTDRSKPVFMFIVLAFLFTSRERGAC